MGWGGNQLLPSTVKQYFTAVNLIWAQNKNRFKCFCHSVIAKVCVWGMGGLKGAPGRAHQQN